MKWKYQKKTTQIIHFIIIKILNKNFESLQIKI